MLHKSLVLPLQPHGALHTRSFRCFSAMRPRFQYGNWRTQRLNPRISTARGRLVPCTAAAGSQDYYSVLGVSRDASAKDIKSAFRKKALKLHPDVNKAPDAKDQFMAAKEAFQVLSDAETRSRYDRQARGSRGFDWGNPFGSAGSGARGSGSGSSGSNSGQKSSQQPAEEFYGFGAFFNDLEREWQERRKRRQKEPGSLWEELTDIGEEFVEFLETELGLPPFEAEAQARSSDSDSRNAAAREAATAGRQAETTMQQAARRAEENAARAKREADARAKAASDDVEDMLAELKRKRAQQ